MRTRKKKEEKERRAEREGERKPSASDSHSGLRSVLCVKQRKGQESPVSSVKFPQREVTLAAGGRKPSAVGQVKSTRWLW